MLLPALLDVIAELLAEVRGREGLGMGPQHGRVEGVVRQRLEIQHGVGDGGGRLFVEVEARHPLDDGFQGAALRKGDHRRPAGLRLERRDAEILLGGEDEGLGPLQVRQQHGERLVAEKGDVVPGDRLDAAELGTVADDHELAVGHLRERLDDEVDLLVGHHPGGGEVEVAALAAAGDEIVDGDVRIDHLGLAAIGLLDAPRDVARTGDEMIDAGGRPHVPDAHALEDHARQEARPAVEEPGFAQILVLEVPGVAHGGVAVADVQLVRPGYHALGHGMAVGDDQVVARQVVLLDGEGHEPQEIAVEIFDEGDLLHEARLHDMRQDHRAVLLRQEIYQSEDIRLRIFRKHGLENLLGAGIGRKPLMYDCNLLSGRHQTLHDYAPTSTVGTSFGSVSRP